MFLIKKLRCTISQKKNKLLIKSSDGDILVYIFSSFLFFLMQTVQFSQSPYGVKHDWATLRRHSALEKRAVSPAAQSWSAAAPGCELTCITLQGHCSSPRCFPDNSPEGIFSRGPQGPELNQSRLLFRPHPSSTQRCRWSPRGRS